jgi:hypothetical protein
MKIKILSISFALISLVKASAQNGFVVDQILVATNYNVNPQELESLLQENFQLIAILPEVNDFKKSIINVNKRAIEDSIFMKMRAYQYKVSDDYSKPTLLRDKLSKEAYYFISDFELSDSLITVLRQVSSAVEISKLKDVDFADSVKTIYRFNLKGACPTASYIEAYYPVWKYIVLEHSKREKNAISSITNIAEVLENSVSNLDTGKVKSSFTFYDQTSLRILMEPRSGFNSELKGEVSGDWFYQTMSISVEKFLLKKLNHSGIFSFSSGFEIARSRIEVNSASGLLEIETSVDANQYTRRTYWRNLKEQYDIVNFKIPFCVGFGRDFTKKFSGIVELGIIPSIALFSSSKIKEGTFDFRGYFSQQDIELNEIPQFGFFDNVNINDYDITLKTKGVQLELSLKTDFIYLLNDRLSLIAQVAFNRLSYPFYLESNESYWFGKADYYGLLNNENIHSLNYASFKIGLICKLNNL